MMNKTEDPDFVASWQKVEEALKRLDENQVNVCSQRNMRPWLISPSSNKRVGTKGCRLGICRGFFEGRE